MLRRGDRGAEVEKLQKALAAFGFDIAVDGIFGPGTETALRSFQKSRSLVADGIAGPKTQSALDQKDTRKLLSQDDIEAAAQSLGVPVAVIMAINEVESRGEGFLTSGMPAILFERHIMWRRLEAHDINPSYWADQLPSIVNRSPGGYQGGHREHKRLKRAKEIDVVAAIESASWGAFQIMGFHWERLGYDSAGDFQTAMKESEGQHLKALVRFIETDPQLHAAVKAMDWHEIARIYNGPNYADHDYHGRLAEAYQKHSAALEGIA